MTRWIDAGKGSGSKGNTVSGGVSSAAKVYKGRVLLRTRWCKRAAVADSGKVETAKMLGAPMMLWRRGGAHGVELTTVVTIV